MRGRACCSGRPGLVPAEEGPSLFERSFRRRSWPIRTTCSCPRPFWLNSTRSTATGQRHEVDELRREEGQQQRAYPLGGGRMGPGPRRHEARLGRSHQGPEHRQQFAGSEDHLRHRGPVQQGLHHRRAALPGRPLAVAQQLCRDQQSGPGAVRAKGQCQEAQGDRICQ